MHVFLILTSMQEADTARQAVLEDQCSSPPVKSGKRRASTSHVEGAQPVLLKRRYITTDGAGDMVHK
jgi:hypothetical protein